LDGIITALLVAPLLYWAANSIQGSYRDLLLPTFAALKTLVVTCFVLFVAYLVISFVLECKTGDSEGGLSHAAASIHTTWRRRHRGFKERSLFGQTGIFVRHVAVGTLCLAGILLWG
jgi:hypothetical protein